MFDFKSTRSNEPIWKDTAQGCKTNGIRSVAVPSSKEGQIMNNEIRARTERMMIKRNVEKINESNKNENQAIDNMNQLPKS